MGVEIDNSVRQPELTRDTSFLLISEIICILLGLVAQIILANSILESEFGIFVIIIDAFATIEEEEAVIREMNIEPYKYADLIDYDPKTPRKLLLHKKEIKRLIGLISTKGLTLIATKVFEQNGYIKIQLALAKGKKDIDKRRKITDKRVRKEIRDFK